MEAFNWREILDTLTDEQRERLKTFRVERFGTLSCDKKCDKCPFAATHGCDFSSVIEKARLCAIAVEEVEKQRDDLVAALDAIEILKVPIYPQRMLAFDSFDLIGIKSAIEKARESK